MNPPNPKRHWAAWALGLLVLLLVTGVLSGCDWLRGDKPSNGRSASGIRAAKKPMPLPEIIVKLDEGKRLKTEIVNGKPTLTYGGAPLTIFDRLPEARNIRIRQSFPEFSRKWQNEHEWRSGRRDSVDVQTLMRLARECGTRGRFEGKVLTLLQRWQSDKDALRGQAATPAVVRLLQGKSQAGDTALAAELVRAVRSDGIIFGERDPDAVPALLDLLRSCESVSPADTQAVYQFAHLLRKEGGDTGVADLALKGIEQLSQSKSIGLRESLAVASWVRLFAGDDALGPTRERPSVDLFLRIQIASREVNVDQLLDRLNRIEEVESAVRAFPLGPSTSAVTSNITQQVVPGAAASYQDPEPGIDVAAAWSVPGGNGVNVRLLVCDASFLPAGPSQPAGHSDLPARNSGAAAVSGQINVIKEPWGDYAINQIHGTQTLGVLLAKHDGYDCASGYVCSGGDADSVEVNGICAGVQDIHFSSVLQNEADVLAKVDGVTSTLDGITIWLGPPDFSSSDVLIIEAQLSADDFSTCEGDACPSMLPVEANYDNFALIQTLVDDYNITVVEPAGNGWGVLSKVSYQSEPQWDPTLDSGAIMVGAGMPSCLWTPHARLEESNYGDRVDCQGWGWLVPSTTLNPFTGSEAFGEFTHTSAATAIIGGFVTCFQSAYAEAYGGVLSPKDLRSALRRDDLGTPQATDPSQIERIGPLPNLRKLLNAFGIVAPIA